MFNALRSDELLVGVGRVLRMAADALGPLDDYERSQLLSASSIVRLLAAELLAERDLLSATQVELEAAMVGERPEIVDARRRVVRAATGAEVGEAIGDLLVELPRDDETRAKVHRVLRGLVDREVAALARSSN